MNNSNHLIIADGHVHIYDCFDIHKFFDAAWNNFFGQSKRMGFEKSFTGILFLTESLNTNRFSEFLQVAHGVGKANSDLKDLKFQETKEDCSLRVLFGDERELTLVAGRQIVSNQNLELLALGITEHFGEGDSMEKIAEEINRRGGIPIIPWGAGKWLGKRGKIVENLIFQNNTSHLFLGDNGNRPYFWLKPLIFNKAKLQGILNIPGSDPLPFDTETDKVGSFGFMVDGPLNSDKPFEDMKRKLLDSSTDIQFFGKLETSIRFFRNQVAMQLIKHKAE